MSDDLAAGMDDMGEFALKHPRRTTSTDLIRTMEIARRRAGFTLLPVHLQDVRNAAMRDCEVLLRSLGNEAHADQIRLMRQGDTPEPKEE
jgi:hypothetical protein